MKTATTLEAVEVVYNLYEYGEGLYLPNAFIVSKDREGYLAHIQQRATAETIGAFGLQLDAVRTRLFAIIEELQPAALEARFRGSQRRAPTLDQLLEDRESKRQVEQYVHRRLDELLTEAIATGLPLSWDVERRVLVKDFVLEPVADPLEPQMAFHRSAEGVTYRLRLIENGQPWKITQREVAAITNTPAWIVADFRLYRIAHLNGFLVKPFRQRDEVQIPAAKVVTYFRTFIMKIVSKVEIEADGFAVEQFDELRACRLEVKHHLFDGHYLLAVHMEYPHFSFAWNDVRRERPTLDINGDDVRILQVRRRPEAERRYLDELERRGLRLAENSNCYRPADEADNPFATLEWLLRERAELEAAGFIIQAPEPDGQRLYLHPGRLTVSVSEDNDWFDLRGEVVVGEFRIPFGKLVRFIREGKHLYPLPNGQHFLIPREWFARYGEVAQFARDEGQSLRLARSHYTLLEHLDEAADVLEPAVLLPDFRPSPALRATLRPYQLEGVRWLVAHYHQKLGACLADDMGLGKTVQTLAVLLYAKDNKPVAEAAEGGATPQLDLFSAAADSDFLRPLNALIVLPASLVFNWESEIRQFAPSLSIYRHTGPQRYHDVRLLRRFDIMLTTYQTALRDEALLSQIEYEYIVLDESQQIKNHESKAFKAINTLRARHRISLSGTPIENSLSDLWSQMQFLNPGLLRSYPFFRKEFIVPIERGQDDGKKARLRRLVQPYLLRRTKEEVARDLPPQHTRLFYCEMTTEQRRLYEREKSSARNYLLDHYAANDAKYRMLVVQTLTKLRQLANHPRLIKPEYDKDSGKFTDVLEQWDVVRKAGHKVLFFSSFVQYLELFRTELDGAKQPYSWLTGDQTAAQRQSAVERFQREADIQAFLISIKTGGTGLNLTAADYVFILDPWWNPTVEQQAIARAHRIGQDKPVIALKFITRDSIEEKIVGLQQRKSRLAEDILGTSEKLALERRDIEYLLA